MGDAIGAISSLAGGFGGSEETGSPGSSNSSTVSGYYALPPQAQNAYNNFFNLINGLGSQNPYTPPAGSYTNYNGNPNSPFTSQGLLGLQQANPNTPINPSGFLEPFNQYQQNALSSLGNPDLSAQGLSQYSNPFQSMVTDQTLNEISRQGGIDRNNLTDRASRLNSSAFNNSALGTQLAQNTDNTNRLRANATAQLGYQGYNSALDLRNQTLGQQLSAGSAIQGQNQQALGYANPLSYNQTQYQLNPQYGLASVLAPFFGAFPNNSSSSSTTQTGSSITPNSYQPTGLTQAGGLGTALFGGSLKNSGGINGVLNKYFGI